MDKQELEAKIEDRKKALEKTKEQDRELKQPVTGPYSDVEFDHEIRELEMEIQSLERQKEDLD